MEPGSSQNKGSLSRHCNSKKINGLRFEIRFESCNAEICPIGQVVGATHQIEIRQGVKRIFLGQIDLRMPSNNVDDVANLLIAEIETRLINCKRRDCLGLSQTTLLVDQDRLASMFWAAQIIDITKGLLYEILRECSIPRRVFTKNREAYLQAFPT